MGNAWFQRSLWTKPVSVSIITDNLKASIVLSHERELNLSCLVWRKKNRSHFEIIASVLEAVKKKDMALYHLMKHTGSNYAELRKYLESLAEIGFIEMDKKEDRVMYRASERGRDFLRQYHILLHMLLDASAYEDIVLPKAYVYTH